MKHAKKQEYGPAKGIFAEDKKLTGDPWGHTLIRLEEDFKSTGLSMLKKLGGTIDKELGEVRRMMSHQIETVNKK